MPVTKSAAKRVRQTIKRHRHNLRIKQVLQRDVKALLNAIAANDKSVGDKFKSAQSSIDKATKANLIHKNKAARKKAQLVKAVKAGAPKVATKAKVAAKKAVAKPSAKSE